MVRPPDAERPQALRRRHDLMTDETLGDLRRLDSGRAPDRHPAVKWLDERRPRPCQVEGTATAVADRLRERMQVLAAAEPAAVAARPPAARRAPAQGRVPRPPLAPDRPPPPSPTSPARSASGAGEPADPRRASAGTGRQPRRTQSGVEANARLTGSTAAVLLVLLVIEGLTILRIQPLLSVHVFVGALLIPVVLLKVGSTTWRFAKYYLGDPAYRRKGPPAPLLRLIGPAMVLLTLAVLATGVALVVAPVAVRPTMLLLHQGTFVAWFVLMAVHVLAHLLDTARLAPRDWYWRTRNQVRGASARQWLVASSVALGLVAGVLLLPPLAHWVLVGRG